MNSNPPTPTTKKYARTLAIARACGTLEGIKKGVSKDTDLEELKKLLQETIDLIEPYSHYEDES